MSKAAAAPQASIGRALLTLLVFLALGPLVGGVLMIVGLGLVIGIETGQYGGMLASIATMMIYGLWTSWFMGALPALLVGLVVAVIDGFRRGSWVIAAGIGSIAGIVLAVGAGGLRNLAIGACYFLACLGATLVCYAATRGFARR